MHWINSNTMHEVWKLNEDMLKQKYRMHNLYVKVCVDFLLFKDLKEKFKTRVPKERLLVWDVSDGWEPLCKFLDQPVPIESFPQLNKANSDKNY